jgi:superfamily II DNA or RNA helicase
MGAFHIGATASPERSDGVGLYPTYKHIIVAAQRQQLIKQGYLVPTHVLAPSRVLRSAVADIPVKLWEKYARGSRTIVFARDTEHARSITAEFAALGWPTGYVDGDMPANVRRNVIGRFIDGRTMILVNCKILTEGFNLPAIDTVVLACNVGHDGLFMQMVGRAGRIAPGKKFATCLDLCGNYHVHGLPDENRKFSLRGRAVQLASTGVPMRRCVNCSKTWRSSSATCPKCGARIRPSRKAMQYLSERLAKVNPAKLARARQERFNELWDHARVTGRDREWIEQRFRAQFGVSCAGMRPTHKRTR